MKPYIVLQYNLSLFTIKDMSYFDTDEQALKWIDFVLENEANKVISKGNGVAMFTNSEFEVIKVHLKTT